MATTNTTADDKEQAGSSGIAALEQRLSEQTDHQEEFQTFLLTRTDPDADAAKQFQEELIDFIKTKMTAEEIGIQETAIALWEQVAMMEQNVRESGDEEREDSDMSVDSRQANLPEAGRDHEEATLPNDPAFQEEFVDPSLVFEKSRLRSGP
jgi:hypothetical protein